MDNPQITTKKYDNIRNSDDINTILLLTSNKTIIDLRHKIKEDIILLALEGLEKNSEISIPQIIDRLYERTKRRFSEIEILPYLERMCNQNVLKYSENSKIIILKKVKTSSFDEVLYLVTIEFLDYFKKEYGNEEYLSIDSNDLINVKKIFNSIIRSIISKFANVNPLDNSPDFIPIEDLDKFIEENVDEIQFNYDKLQQKVKYYLFNYLTEDYGKELKDLISKCYFATIEFDLIKKEKKIPNLCHSEVISFLLLDASFIIALWCETDPKHPLSKSIVENCREKGIKLQFSEKTKNEIRNIIKFSNYEAKKLRNKDHRSALTQFTVDFLRQNTSWDEYYSFLSNWENYIQVKYNIFQVRKNVDNSVSKDVFNVVKEILPMLDKVRIQERSRDFNSYQLNYRAEIQISNDAHCIALVAQLQKEAAKNASSQIGPLFLSYDNLLSTLNYERLINYSPLLENKEAKLGFVIQPRILLNYLLIYSNFKFDKEQEENLVKALLQYTARTNQSRISIKEYSKLVGEKINIDSENIDKIEKLLILDPLKSELKRALELGDIAKSDDIFTRIITRDDIDDFVGKLSKDDVTEKDQTIDNLRKSLRTTKEKAEDEISKRANLEKKLNKETRIEYVNDVDELLIKKINGFLIMMDADKLFSNNLVEKPSKRMNKKQFILWMKTTKKQLAILEEKDETLIFYKNQMEAILKNVSGET